MWKTWIYMLFLPMMKHSKNVGYSCHTSWNFPAKFVDVLYVQSMACKALQVDEEDEEEEDEEEKAPADEDLCWTPPTQWNGGILGPGDVLNEMDRTSLKWKEHEGFSTDQANPLAWNRSSNWHEETCEQVIRNQIEHIIWNRCPVRRRPLEFSTAEGSRKNRGGFQEDEIKAIEAEMKEMKEDLSVGYVIWRRTKTEPLAVVGFSVERRWDLTHGNGAFAFFRLELLTWTSHQESNQSWTHNLNLFHISPLFLLIFQRLWTNLWFFCLGFITL